MMKAFTIAALLSIATLMQGCYSPMSTLERDLAKGFAEDSELRFVGHEIVQREEADSFGNEKYLILDFRNNTPFINEHELQASINQICKTVFGNQSLIKDLSDEGYDMISVSFEASSQYDCL